MPRERSREGATNIWLTPKYIIDDLGPFDLDPCAAPEPRPWPTAKNHIVEAQDGLAQPWQGFCFVNPPYGQQAPAWMAKLAEHDDGIALTFARTETKMFFESVWNKAAGLLFVKGRIMFYHPDGTRAAGSHTAAPSVLMGYGDEALKRLARSGIQGHLVVNSAILLSSDGIPCGTWREAIEQAMSGRVLRVRDIYRAAEGTSKVRVAKAKGHNWRAQIRRALQEYFEPVQYGVWSAA